MRILDLMMGTFAKSVLLYSSLIIVIAGLYLFRFYTVRDVFKEGDRVRVSGALSEEPGVTGGRQKVVVGRFSFFADRFPEYHYGDRVVVEGVVKEGKVSWYLEGAQIQTGPGAGSSHPMSSAVSPAGTRWDPLRPRHPSLVSLHSLRQRILSLYQKYLPEPHASLLSGIVLGIKSSLDSEFFDALRRTGTLHVVVASGTNVALVGGSILESFAFILGRKRALVLALFSIWTYVLLVGLQPPILRAGLMGSIAFAALALGRQVDGWRALILSAIALLFWQPLWLFDTGFQLSFLATAGIIGLSARLGKLGELGRVPRGIRETLATTLSAQIAVSPVLFFKFGQISLISPVVNVLVLPIIPLLMLSGMIVGAVGVVGPPAPSASSGFGEAMQVLFWFVWIPLAYFVGIVELFAKIS